MVQLILFKLIYIILICTILITCTDSTYITPKKKYYTYNCVHGISAKVYAYAF